MKLHLRYNEHIHGAASAAFIRSNDAKEWLREIGRWKLPVDELECYIVPVSIQSPEPTGLFVIFKNAEVVRHIDLLEAYTCIAQKLFIPVNAELLPQTSEQELARLLVWDRQVFHHVNGFIGFERNDQVVLHDLF